MPFCGLFILLVVAVVVLVVTGMRQAAERRKRLAAWARSQGLRYDADRIWGFDDRYPDFRTLRAGDGGRFAYNVMHGIRGGRRVVCFDYHYETRSTDSKGRSRSHAHNFSALIVETGLPLPGLFVRPEGLLDRIGAFFGFEDIDFESARFSRRFKVTSDNRRWAYDVIHPETIEFMLGREDYTLQIARGDLLLADDRQWSCEKFSAALAYAEGFLDLIPRGVLADLNEAEV